MVGGSTRIRKIRQLVKDYFGPDTVIKTDIPTTELVMWGAAIQAERLAPGTARPSKKVRDQKRLVRTPASSPHRPLPVQLRLCLAASVHLRMLPLCSCDNGLFFYPQLARVGVVRDKTPHSLGIDVIGDLTV